MEANPGAADLVELACRLARLHGLRWVVSDGPLPAGGADRFDPGLRLLEVMSEDAPVATPPAWFGRRARWSSTSSPEASGIVAESVVLCTVGTSTTSDAWARLANRAPVAVIADGRSDKEPSLATLLGAADLQTTFVGSPNSTTLAFAISDKRVGNPTDTAPPDFRVLAVMTAYNEEDIIGPSLQVLIDQGIDVHLIDNWSTDRTFEIASGFLGRGLVGLERFPQAPSSTFDLEALLRRVEHVADGSDADWILHHDADERRTPPWNGLSLRDGLWIAQRAGFNAVDHTVIEFQPVDDSYRPGVEPEAQFEFFEFGGTIGHERQIRAWRRSSVGVNLAESGGHEAAFRGRRVFPYKFLLKHYPIRSQSHGERKILRERQARWNAAERARGWHLQYDGVGAGHSFVRSADELRRFEPGVTEVELLLPLISGIGLASSPIPSWARASRWHWRAFQLVAWLDQSAVTRRARRVRLFRAPGRWIRSRLMRSNA